ncbi:MAG: Zn-ribbon domain-containing OB-fold protein [Acidimicrobiales bacterium]
MTEPTSPAQLPVGTPHPNPDSAPFWAATAEGRFLLQRCTGCGTVMWWPRAVCPECSSFDLAWFEATGEGTVYSFSIVRRTPDRRWAPSAPYVLAYVELDEGPRVMTNIVDCDPDTVTVDQRVRVVWHDTGEGSALPRFTPAGG